MLRVREEWLMWFWGKMVSSRDVFWMMADGDGMLLLLYLMMMLMMMMQVMVKKIKMGSVAQTWDCYSKIRLASKAASPAFYV